MSKRDFKPSGKIKQINKKDLCGRLSAEVYVFDHKKTTKIKNEISDIGTNILFLPLYGQNSTQKAPPELIPELTTMRFHVDSEFNVKT